MSTITISPENIKTAASISTSAANAAQNSAESNPLLIKIQKVIAIFQKNTAAKITPNCQQQKEGDVYFYGIHKNTQLVEVSAKTTESTLKIYKQLKACILKNMGIDASTEVVQVVGDSSPFSLAGTQKATAFLEKQLFATTTKIVALYGYTGHSKADGTRCVNDSLSHVLKTKRCLEKTIGNLVAYHTPQALSKWGCTGPDLKHYVIVYGDDESSSEKGTLFGDDVITSDFLADKLLMLCGGAQSFKQACNALLLDQKIQAFTGLRPPERTIYFDAARFFQQIAEQTKLQTEHLTEGSLDKWYKQYFLTDKWSLINPAPFLEQIAQQAKLQGANLNAEELKAHHKIFFAPGKNIDMDPSKFLQHIAEYAKQHGANLNENCLYNIYKKYFLDNKCFLADPSKPDYATKQKLFDDAWGQFVINRLDKKIATLVTFH